MQDDSTPWYDDSTATFGDRLTAAREHAGLTPAALANRLGVKESTLRAWEDDHKEPRANRLQMLAGMLNISLSWLLTGRGDGPDGPAEDVALGADILEILAQMRQLRGEMTRASDRLGQLEKRLRVALKEVA